MNSSRFDCIWLISLLMLLHHSIEAQKDSRIVYEISDDSNAGMLEYLYLLPEGSTELNFNVQKMDSLHQEFQRYLELKSELGHGAFYWGRITLRNKHPETSNWILYVGSSMVENIDIYIPEGQDFTHYRSGRFVNAPEQIIRQLDEPKTPLTIGKGETKTIYFRIQSWHFPEEVYYLPDHVFSLDLQSATDFVDRVSHNYLLKGITIGSFGLMFLIGMILYVFTKDRVYLYYAIHVFFFALFAVNNKLILTEYFFVNHSDIGKILWVFGASALIPYLLFFRAFVNIRADSILWDNIVKYAFYLFSSLMVIDLFVAFFSKHSYQIGIIIHWAVLLQVLFMIVLQFVVLYYRRTDRLSQIFVAGSFIFIMSTLVFELSSYDHDSQAVEFASVAEGLVMALGLGYRIKLRNDGQKELLEREVNSRTSELEAKRAALDKSNQEKEVLLKEIHHRVKNNLQVISSLLNLQMKSISDDVAKNAVSGGRERVKSIALIHEKLYENNNFAYLEMKDYTLHLLDELLVIYQVDKRGIEVESNIENIDLDIESAVSVGLILNELMTNALKYAIPTTSTPKLTIDLHLRKSILGLDFADNGTQASKLNFDSFGLGIVSSLTKQLGGEMDVDASASGLEYNFQFTEFGIRS